MLTDKIKQMADGNFSAEWIVEVFPMFIAQPIPFFIFVFLLLTLAGLLGNNLGLPRVFLKGNIAKHISLHATFSALLLALVAYVGFRQYFRNEIIHYYETLQEIKNNKESAETINEYFFKAYSNAFAWYYSIIFTLFVFFIIFLNIPYFIIKFRKTITRTYHNIEFIFVFITISAIIFFIVLFNQHLFSRIYNLQPFEWIDIKLGITSIILFSSITVIYIIYSLTSIFGKNNSKLPLSPAMSICGFFAWLLSYYSICMDILANKNLHWFQASSIAWIPVFLLIISSIVNKNRYKLQRLKDYYDLPEKFKYQVFDETPINKDNEPSLLGVSQIQNPPLDFSTIFNRDNNNTHAVFCLSGGGMAAAAWSGALLPQLENQIPNLAKRTHLVCGASGGMVAGGLWATARTKDGPTYTASEIFTTLTKDLLSPVVRQMITVDLPALFLPLRKNTDRGDVIEASLISNTSAVCRKTNKVLESPLINDFHALREGEEEGWRPPLAFSPTVIENGKRFIISNLDFEDPDKQLFKRPKPIINYRDVSHMPISVATAARLSASFPIITPSVELPTHPPLRVVDAGYHDNWGVGLAANWMLDNYNDIEKSSKIVVFEINAYDKYVNTRNHNGRVPWTKRRLLKWIPDMFQDILTPVQAVFNARKMSSSVSNDFFLEHLAERFISDNNENKSDTKKLKIIRLTSSANASLSWRLSSKEKDQIYSEAIIQSKLASHVIKSFWNDGEGNTAIISTHDLPPTKPSEEELISIIKKCKTLKKLKKTANPWNTTIKNDALILDAEKPFRTAKTFITTLENHPLFQQGKYLMINIRTHNNWFIIQVARTETLANETEFVVHSCFAARRYSKRYNAKLVYFLPETD